MNTKLYVDYLAGKKGEWLRCPLDEVEKHRSEIDFFITWQRYANEHMGQFGEMYGNCVFDFDHEEDIEIAQRDCLKLYGYLKLAGVKPENIRIFFSGSKGFHLEIDYRAYIDKPVFDLHLIYKEFYRYLESKIKPEKNKSTMDAAIYSQRRMWRYPNTQHSKTGLYCVPLTYDELTLGYTEIFDLASFPRDIDFNSVYVDDLKMRKYFADCQTAVWKSTEDFEKRTSLIKNFTGGYPLCIKRVTEEGIPRGMRNNTIYQIARFLKGIRKESEVYDQIKTIAANSYDNDREFKAVQATVASALKREGSFLSCSAMSRWCDKDQCNIFTKKESKNHLSKIDKTFDICSYKDAVTLLRDAIKRGEYFRVLKTGIIELDRKTKVLQDSVIVIASLSDMGKTSFAVTIAKNNQDKKIMYLPIEEGRDRGALRLLRSKVSEEKNITFVTGRIGEITPDDIYSLAYTQSNKFDFMIIDQLVNLTAVSKEERLKYKIMMEKFREIAREFRKPIFVLHQLNRSAKWGKDDEPSKEQLAEGADIERLAYDVWLLYRRKFNDKAYNLLKIDKNKNYRSPVIVPLDYDFSTNTFKDYPSELIDWNVFGDVFGVDEKEYYNGHVEEDIVI